MENKDIKELLTGVAEGSVSVEDALLKLKKAPFEEIGIASLDHHRAIRQGAAEVVYGAGKTSEQINLIARSLWEKGQKTILITRLSAEKAESALMDMGFSDLRVRVFGGGARLQLKESQMAEALNIREEIVKALKPFFNEILLDMEAR